jgi:hypothetical protein
MPSGVGRGRRLSNTDRAKIRTRIHAGEQYRAVAAVVGCDPLTVQKVVARYGGVVSWLNVFVRLFEETCA